MMGIKDTTDVSKLFPKTKAVISPLRHCAYDKTEGGKPAPNFTFNSTPRLSNT